MAKPKATKPSKGAPRKGKGLKSSGVKGVSDGSKKRFKKKKGGRAPHSKARKAVAKDTQPITEKQPPHTEEAARDAKKTKGAPFKKKPSGVVALTTKDRRAQRRQQKEGYTLTREAKLLWERLRRRDVKGAERETVLSALMAVIKGHIHELCLKHDTARVVQWGLKFGTKQQRTAICSELKEHIIELSKLKYAKHTVKALLKYCTPLEKNHVISALYDHVRRLIRHKEASEVVETAYNDYANASQRASLIRQFYGPQFMLCMPPPSSLDRHDDDKEEEEPIVEKPTDLGGTLQSHPGQRAAILKHLKETLTSLLEKGSTKHSIVHRALLDFFQHCDTTARTEMVEAVRETVVSILHTKDGSRVALNCLWHGTPKDRKIIVKSFKTFVKKICMEENGHVVMMGVFDTVDDTVLVKKVLLSEMASHLEELCNDRYGRRVLLYLLSPRSSKHFSPQFLSILTPGDGNQHSKKPTEVRYSELREGLVTPLLDVAGKRVSEWARSKPHAPLLLQIAASIPGDLSVLYRPLLSELAREVEGDTDYIVVDACGHWLLRNLVATKGNADRSFAELLLEAVPANQITAWTKTNRGSFVVCSLLQSGVREKVVEMLAGIEVKGETKGQEALRNSLSQSN